MKKPSFAFQLLWLAVMLAGIGIFLKARVSAQPSRGAAMTPVSSVAMPAPPSRAAQPVPARPVPRASGAAPAAVRGEPGPAWERFRDRFGSELAAEFTPAGRLASARGTAGQGSRAGTDFHPDDPQKAIARAREVLNAARELLGVVEELPLADPVARTGAVSAQVTFRETLGGVPLLPYGAVTVDLGPQGELLGLDSNYVPGIRAANTPLIREDQARSAVLAQATPDDSGGGLKLEGGAPIVWLSSPSGPALHAYVYSYRGHQVVVDAADGKILARRDQRNY